jgi:mono/diheme cytochrome c family protein
MFGVDSPTIEPQVDAGAGGVATAGTTANNVKSDAGNTLDMAGEPACAPAVASDHLRPRTSVMASARDQATQTNASGVFTRDLFNLFRTNCGACHVEQSLGGLHVALDDFPTKVTAEAVKRISSDDPAYFMPPPGGGGKPFSSRTKSDPVVELASLLQAWLAARSPADVFYPQNAAGTDSMTLSYRLQPDVATQMTNLGNCVPNKAMLGSEGTKSAALDAMFAKATELPERLEQTDLVTFDAKELAREGVVAFAPAYTLWADNAKKIRMLRPPRGQSIVFDKDKQSFSIPANTRFYKTFLKRVIDLEGRESYRKMETRLILSRPDDILPDGSRRATALFGTYAWNEQETEAVLVRDPLRNGKPFRDRLVTYITDEQKADAVIAEGPTDLERALEQAGVTRTYAIPGSERCIQCHMGAPNANFILGFIPLQIHRRPMGEGGVIEPADRDELNQLQRLIDYGVITGMSSPRDVVLLEASQGERKPRNDHELNAQGYMLGNCAHCHNPYGFPSVSAPELRDVLNFLPSADGGIFQFPLEKFSPRVLRGPAQDSQIPYITPSLYDLHEDSVAPKKFYRSKNAQGVASDNFNHVLAPWRSLIYRNVDAPFSYVDDSAIFPHMPRHTAGYDCRARQLLGKWMVSIPARVKTSALVTNAKEEVTATANDLQPYLEIKAGEPAYEQAIRDAYYRVDDFTKGPRYRDCPDPALDIIDPKVRDNANLLAPRTTFVDDAKLLYDLPVPERPHWFVTDLTDTPGDWYPRRTDWRDIIVAHKENLFRFGEKQLVDLLATVRVSANSALRDLALTDVPFGLWQEKKACQFPASMLTVANVPLDKRPQWMRGVAGGPPASDAAHVYSISPGAQLFTSICRNCHGPEADAKSRLADTIADLTGGGTRVANLRDGIIGPIASPGANRTRVFGAVAVDQLTADDWAARYLVWMTLGGTQRVIPPAVLTLVGNTYVIGEKRSGGKRALQSGTANMLQVAQFLCGEVLPATDKLFDPLRGALRTPAVSASPDDSSPLIYRNGDGEMWERLCAFQNPLPVRVVTATQYDATQGPRFRVPVVPAGDNTPAIYDVYKRDAYGSGAVGDERGGVRPALDDTNQAPWCIREPDAKLRVEVDKFWTDHGGGGTQPPYCPQALVVEANRLTEDAVTAWTQRGAMNAGLSVFLYLDALGKGEKKRLPEYNRCEELSAK